MDNKLIKWSEHSHFWLLSEEGAKQQVERLRKRYPKAHFEACKTANSNSWHIASDETFEKYLRHYELFKKIHKQVLERANIKRRYDSLAHIIEVDMIEFKELLEVLELKFPEVLEEDKCFSASYDWELMSALIQKTEFFSDAPTNDNNPDK